MIVGISCVGTTASMHILEILERKVGLKKVLHCVTHECMTDVRLLTQPTNIRYCELHYSLDLPKITPFFLQNINRLKSVSLLKYLELYFNRTLSFNYS